MIAAIGHVAILLAFLLALSVGVASLMAAQRPALLSKSRPIAGLLTSLVAIAFACLMAAFISNDFSLLVVARHSSLTLPLIYKIAAVWAGHEGSLLLWVLLLCTWTLAVTFYSRQLPEGFAAQVLGVLMLLIAALLLFLLFASDPFAEAAKMLSDGRGLNPLLQDLSMVLHPPVLFIGTAGLAVTYAVAVASLLSPQFASEVLLWLRPWAAGAWAFLTLGIGLGSWWAYHELGWGGWWFWDPVENAALMPWLAATALLHGLAASRLSGHFRPWTYLLALTAFALVLLGSFLVRSGILNSVHAFAADPRRGIVMLIMLAVLLGGALVLYAKRAPLLAQGKPPSLFSREALLLTGTMLLMVACATVLLGTLYPLLLQVLGLGRISVGAPYFNRMFALLMAPALLLMVIATVLGRGARKPGCGRRWGMFVAHLGVVCFALGATFSNGGEVREVKMTPGKVEIFAGYHFKFNGVQVANGDNDQALRGHFVWSSNDASGALYPEKRLYSTSPMPITEVALVSSLWRDLYISLGEPVDRENVLGAWTVHIQIKPMMNWIWAGFLLMTLGGFVAVLKKKKVPA